MFYHCILEIVHLGFMTENSSVQNCVGQIHFLFIPPSSTPLALTLHDPVLRRKVVDIVLEIFVPRCLLEGEGLRLDEAVQEVALLTVLSVLGLSLAILSPVEAAQARPGLPLPLDGELPLDRELRRGSLLLLRPGHWGLGTDWCGARGIS